MAELDFYQAGPLTEIAVNLFYGWGYNFYRDENKLRADDLLIRTKAATLLGQARASLESAEAALRRTFPVPSRAQPYPAGELLTGAKTLERLSQVAGALAARLHALPAPENDRMTRRYRQERATLQRLAACDELLIGQAELLRAALDGKGAEAILAMTARIEDGFAAIQETFRQRQAILSDPA